MKDLKKIYQVVEVDEDSTYYYDYDNPEEAVSHAKNINSCSDETSWMAYVNELEVDKKGGKIYSCKLYWEED